MSTPLTPFEGGNPAELSWQERALCAETDPEAFLSLIHI
jgi:hypothetical protein